jgi:hypothetical protein
MLILPSAVAPSENNWLLNPLHIRFHEIKLEDTEPFHYDPGQTLGRPLRQQGDQQGCH